MAVASTRWRSMASRHAHGFSLLLVSLLAVCSSNGDGQTSGPPLTPADVRSGGNCVEGVASEGSFALAAAGEPAPLVIGSDDYPGVHRVAEDLAEDLERATGQPPRVLLDTDVMDRDEVVLIGTLGRNSIIAGLVRSGRLDVSDVEGRWRSSGPRYPAARRLSPEERRNARGGRGPLVRRVRERC